MHIHTYYTCLDTVYIIYIYDVLYRCVTQPSASAWKYNWAAVAVTTSAVIFSNRLLEAWQVVQCEASISLSLYAGTHCVKKLAKSWTCHYTNHRDALLYSFDPAGVCLQILLFLSLSLSLSLLPTSFKSWSSARKLPPADYIYIHIGWRERLYVTTARLCV